MSNFDNFKETVEDYLAVNGIELSFLSTLREVSLNDTGKRYLK